MSFAKRHVVLFGKVHFGPFWENWNVSLFAPFVGRFSLTALFGFCSVETRQFTMCGHVGNVPPNMGRGQARVRRLDEFFNRCCLQCQLARDAVHYASLTIPATEDQKARRLQRVLYSYR